LNEEFQYGGPTKTIISTKMQKKGIGYPITVGGVVKKSQHDSINTEKHRKRWAVKYSRGRKGFWKTAKKSVQAKSP